MYRFPTTVCSELIVTSDACCVSTAMWNVCFVFVFDSNAMTQVVVELLHIFIWYTPLRERNPDSQSFCGVHHPQPTALTPVLAASLGRLGYAKRAAGIGNIGVMIVDNHKRETTFLLVVAGFISEMVATGGGVGRV